MKPAPVLFALCALAAAGAAGRGGAAGGRAATWPRSAGGAARLAEPDSRSARLLPVSIIMVSSSASARALAT